MCSRACVLLALVCGIAGFNASRTAAESPPAGDSTIELLNKLPDSVNAVAVIRLDDLLSSPRAREEKWAMQYEVGYLSGALTIPPIVRTVVLGAHFDPATQSRTVEYGVAQLKKRLPWPIREWARANQGEISTIGGQEVALTPQHGYVAEVATGIIAGSAPPNRQEFARWLRFAKGNQQPLISAYLVQAVDAKPGAQVVLAIDLHEMVSSNNIANWLASSVLLKDRPSDRAAIEKLLQGLRGVRFTAQVEQKTHGQVWFDFGDMPSDSQAEVVLALFQEWMRDTGAVVDEFTGPSVHVHAVNHSVLVDTILSDSSIRRIMTLLPQPGGAVQAASLGPQNLMAGPGLATAGALNRWYFQQTEDLLDELRKAARKSQSYAQFTVWHETYARKIEQLPATHVEPELVKYGGSVADHLRALAASLRGVAVEVVELEGQKRFYYYQDPPQVSYSWGGWWGRPINIPSGRSWNSWSWNVTPGNVHYGDNFADVRSRQTEAVTKGEADRTAIWSQIEQERQAIRQTMTERYKEEFTERRK